MGNEQEGLSAACFAVQLFLHYIDFYIFKKITCIKGNHPVYYEVL